MSCPLWTWLNKKKAKRNHKSSRKHPLSSLFCPSGAFQSLKQPSKYFADIDFQITGRTEEGGEEEAQIEKIRQAYCLCQEEPLSSDMNKSKADNSANGTYSEHLKLFFICRLI